MHHVQQGLAGLGLRSPHMGEVLATRPAVAWWEVHNENYFGGGEPVAALEQVRADYPVSLHGVGMGLGNLQAPDPRHLAEVRSLIERIQPFIVSEHLAWNCYRQQIFPDLLPVPRLEGSLARLAAHIAQAQDALGRRLLIENVSSYVAFRDEVMSEGEMLAELVQRTGCGVLLDVNNLYVNALNLGTDARAQIDCLPAGCVGEIHVAGFEWFEGRAIDTHGAPVRPEVWALLDYARQRFGSAPVLLERDSNLPPLAELLAEYRTLQARVCATREEALPC